VVEAEVEAGIVELAAVVALVNIVVQGNNAMTQETWKVELRENVVPLES